MKTSLRFFAVAAVAGLAVLTLGTSAQAQFRPGLPGRVVAPYRPFYRTPIVVPPNTYINPNYWISPTMTLNQYAYNMSVLGRAYASLPPWLYGYNPYPNPIINYGPTYPYINTTPYGGLGYNPYLYYNPYFAAMGFRPF